MTDQERKDLCETFFGMVEVVVDEFLSRERNRRYSSHRDDLMGIGMVSLRKASLKFDPDRGFQFNTYASNAIRYEMIWFLKKIQKQEEMEVPFCNVVETDDEPRTEDIYEEGDDNEGIIEGLAPTDTQDRIIYYGLIVHSDPKAEVAKAAGVTIRKTGYMKKRIIKTIRSNMGVTI